MSDADRITDRLAKITEQFGTEAGRAWLEGVKEARQGVDVKAPEPPKPSLPKSQEEWLELKADDPERARELGGYHHPVTKRFVPPKVEGFDPSSLPTERQLNDLAKSKWAKQQRELKAKWQAGERDAIEIVHDESTGAMSFAPRKFDGPTR